MTNASLTHPHLRLLLADAEATRAETERLRDTLSAAQRTWKPEPGVWSVADCFEHLRKVDKAYARKLDEAIGRAGAGTVDYKPSFFARHFIRFISPQSKTKLKAPKGIRPSTDTASADADALERFLDQQAVVLALIRRADGQNINGGTFGSPLASIVRLTVGEGLTLLVRHEQRHLGQGQRVTERPGFPQA